MFVTRMRPPTAVPSIRVGRMRTTYAAIGAAKIPPIRSAPTTCQGTSAKLRAKKNPRLAHTATTNSLVSTVPMTLRGSILPEVSRVGVEIGPHHPPPAASKNPATNPKGLRNFLAIGLTTTGLSFLLNEKRARTYTPRQKRKIATNGAAASAEIELNATAPTNAPIPPGMASQVIFDQSTLPNLQCDAPDTNVVPTLRGVRRWRQARARCPLHLPTKWRMWRRKPSLERRPPAGLRNLAKLR